jgi:hypothetical protein
LEYLLRTCQWRDAFELDHDAAMSEVTIVSAAYAFSRKRKHRFFL